MASCPKAAALAATERSASPHTPDRRPGLRRPSNEPYGQSPRRSNATTTATAALCTPPPVAVGQRRNSQLALTGVCSGTRATTPDVMSTTTAPTTAYGPESPILLSMSQRARQLGFEVTWVSSPKRRLSSSPLIDRPASSSDGGSSPTELIRRRSLKHRQIFKPQLPHGDLPALQRRQSSRSDEAPAAESARSHKHPVTQPAMRTAFTNGHNANPEIASSGSGAPSKRGIYKFSEELKRLTNETTKATTDTRPTLLASAASSASSSAPSTQYYTARNDSLKPAGSATRSAMHPATGAAAAVSRPPISLSFGTPVRMSSVTPQRPHRASSTSGTTSGGSSSTDAHHNGAEAMLSDFLSTSMQNEFLDNSDLDMELYASSQDAEYQFNRQQEQQQQQQQSNLHQSAFGAPAACNTPNGVAKGKTVVASFSAATLLDNDSIDEFLSSKELDAFISSSQAVPVAKKTSAIASPARAFERHNSMPFQKQYSDLLSDSDDDDLVASMDETLARANGAGGRNNNGTANGIGAKGHSNAGGGGSSSSGSGTTTVLGRYNSMPLVSPRTGVVTPRRQLRAYVPPPSTAAGKRNK